MPSIFGSMVKAVFFAYEKGYRVSDDGVFLSPGGQEIKQNMGSTGYARKSLYEGSRTDGSRKLHPLYIHKLAAMFGLARQTIGNMVNRKTHKQVI